jgi:AcrR family transcriptional regulator
LARRNALLEEAMRIISVDGVTALNMQHLADGVGVSVGTVYTYFPSKGALLAELQTSAISRIADALRTVRGRSQRLLDAAGAPRAERAAAGVTLFGEFFISAWDALPEESHLLLSFLAEREEITPPEYVGGVAGASVALLAVAHEAFDEATAAGVMDPGPNIDRVTVAAASLLGTLLTSHLSHLDPVTFDHRRLTRMLWHDLLRGWGVSDRDLVKAEVHLAALAEEAPLA